MLVDSKMIAFRRLSASHAGNAPWVSLQQQSVIWNRLFDMVREATAQGLMPVVLVDLDLTTLLAPQKSRDVLTELASHAVQFGAVAGSSDGTLETTLEAIWRGAEPALLPGYTTTSIQAYGIYCAAQLSVRTGHEIAAERLPLCEKWIADQVHAKLRSDYWNRDLSRDDLADGFAKWAMHLAEVGGRIVFLSNRDPSAREASLHCIRQLLGDGKEPCVFFGPGGSAFDASSKAAAVPLIENGVVAGIHFGTEQDGQTVYPDAVTAGTPQTILAVIDDRAENRRQLIEASARSSSRLIAKGLDDIMDIASAAKGFCPEVDVAGMAAVVSSFVFEANV